MNLLLSGRSRPPGPSSVIAFLPGLALRLDWGPHVIGPLAGWHRGFPAEAEQDAKADLRTPRLCLSAPFLNS